MQARRLAVVLLALGLFTTLPRPTPAQTLRGLLVDRDTQVPIALGRITMITQDRDSVAATLTDELGFFSLTAPESGTYSLVATALGFRGSVQGPWELADDALQVVSINLGPRPLPLPGVFVSAERMREPEVASLVTTGFYDRLLQGRGEFLTPGEIARSTVRYTPQLFRSMTTVYLDRVLPTDPSSATGSRASAPWNDRVMIRALNPPPGQGIEDRICLPRVYVDDVFMDLEHMDPEPSLTDLAPKDDLLAIEVYRAPFGAPMRYQSTSDCGVVLLWTKARR